MESRFKCMIILKRLLRIEWSLLKLADSLNHLRKIFKSNLLHSLYILRPYLLTWIS